MKISLGVTRRQGLQQRRQTSEEHDLRLSDRDSLMSHASARTCED